MKGLLCFLLLFSAPALAQQSPDSIAQDILTLSNQARQKAGQPPLVLDTRLAQAALQHSQEMDSLNYFSHASPVAAFATLAKRLYLQGVYGLTSAENLHREKGYKAGKTAQHAVECWLNSPVHRKNLLNGKYNRVGMGISVVGDQYTVTQVFSYTAIEVLEKKVDPKPQGIHLSLHCKVADGANHGALLLEGKRCANWQADEQGQFKMEVDLPGPGLVSLGQAEGERSWIVETEFQVAQEPGRS